MTRQKGKFLTFCFSMVPGAGHMYLGFMKQGLSLMTLFAAMCALAVGLEIGPILLFASIVWFYSFFDVINKNSLDPAEFYALEDYYIWGEDWLNVNDILRGKKRKAFAVILFVAAICMIWSSLRYVVNNLAIHWIFRVLFDRLPVLAVAAIIIWLAVRLMQSPQKEGMEEFFVDRNEDIPYPIVHPPVMHVGEEENRQKADSMTAPLKWQPEEERKETAGSPVMGKAEDSGMERTSDVQNGFTDEDFKKSESKIS